MDKVKKKIIFSNSHFKFLAREYEEIIVKNIFKGLNSKRKKILHNDMVIGNDYNIGYSIYQVSDRMFFILLSNISYRKVYLEAKGRNQFYDKVSSLMAEIAHEIGNPLTSVVMTLQVMLSNLLEWDMDKIKEYVQISINELNRMSNFLDKMREISKDIKLKIRPVFLKTVVDQVIFQNRAKMERKNISISNHVDEKLKVLIDGDALFRVFFNLFQNSFDSFTQQGRIKIHIEEVNELFVKLVYQNDGPPIHEEILGKIFIPFFSTKKKGRGIGLDISLRLMTRMGGMIKTEVPEKGWGVKFTLYIPVADSSD
ncbi:MAG: HAMP domain-containing histidine kinase [Candidatus Aminicenantes bacterium]|nr:HAMP domain-containing histidine kinase [Candidatus Aminicenantes bacterium]